MMDNLPGSETGRLCLWGGNVAEDCDAAFGANGSAQRTTGAVMMRVEQDYRPVALGVQFFRQQQHVFGTGISTQLAPFAPIDIDYNSSSCHIEYLRFKWVFSGDVQREGRERIRSSFA
jgi:hypothetical protein